MQRPVVKSHTKGVRKPREGKGYSLAELREVGLDGFRALEKGIPFDKFRKTKHEQNVQLLEEALKG